MALRVALTGGIGSGKTAVSDRLRERGAVVVDADLLSREVVAPGTWGLAAVLERFGPTVLGDDGALDRPALGKLIFNDREARRDLEAIVHPRVRRRAAELESAAPPDAVVVHVIPLLVETKQADQFDQVVVVDVEPQTQFTRVLARGGVDPDGARRRITAQASRADRLAVADHVINNQGPLSALDPQVDKLWTALLSAARPSSPVSAD